MNRHLHHKRPAAHVSIIPIGCEVESDNYAGQYLGALSWVNSCTGLHEDFVDIAVTQVGSNITLNWSNHTTRDACYFGGQLGLDGQFGSMSGQFQCAPVHDDGEFTVTGLRVTPEAITGRYQWRIQLMDATH